MSGTSCSTPYLVTTPSSPRCDMTDNWAPSGKSAESVHFQDTMRMEEDEQDMSMVDTMIDRVEELVL